MSQAPVPAPVYHDNLATARAEGRTGGHNHRSPVATKDVREVAAKLVEDEKYQENLLTRLRAGEAGGMEVWLWRWAYGDPKRATDAESARDRMRFDEMRRELRLLITQNPRAHAELEERVLARTVIAQPAPAGRPEPEPIAALLPGPMDDDEEDGA